MSRRALSLLVLAVASYVAAACAQPTAPRRADTATCKSGWIGSDARTC